MTSSPLPRARHRRRHAVWAAAGAIGVALLAPVGAAASPAALDPAFADDGRLIVTSPDTLDQANAVAVQTDGRIVVAGTTMAAGDADSSDLFVARFERNGTPDATFGTGGRTTIDVAGHADGAWALGVAADGGILVAGYGGVAPGFNHTDYAVARLTAEGDPDPTFAGDGMQMLDFGGGAEQALALAVRPDGQVIVGGYANPAPGAIDFGLARLSADGNPDPTFAGDGRVTTAFAAGNSNVRGLAIDSDGKIVAAGRTEAGGGRFDIALARYDDDGTLDATFGDQGKRVTDLGLTPSSDEAYGVAVQGDGRLIVSGFTAGDGVDSRFAVLRYDAGGTLDPSFDSDGIATIAFAQANDLMPNAYAYSGPAILADGTIVVAGASTSYNEFFEPQSRFALAALTPAGTPDERFAPSGAVTTAFDLPEAEGRAITLDQGRIVVAGAARRSGESDVAIARYAGLQPPQAPDTNVVEGVDTVIDAGLVCPGACATTAADTEMPSEPIAAACASARTSLSAAARAVTRAGRAASRARRVSIGARAATRRAIRVAAHAATRTAHRRAARVLRAARRRQATAQRTLTRARQQLRRAEAKRADVQRRSAKLRC